VLRRNARRRRGGEHVLSSNCPTISAARHGRAVPSYDISAPTGDGRQAWFNVSIVVLPGRRSRDLRAIHMFRDVTARRRAEAFADGSHAALGGHVSDQADAAPTSRASEPGAPAVRLTTRELEILRMLGQGLGTTAIAARLRLSKATVRNHIDRLRSKLGAHSRIEALVRAGQLGIA
jgi:DNA-binding CsgD family transcriptional regulator